MLEWLSSDSSSPDPPAPRTDRSPLFGDRSHTRDANASRRGYGWDMGCFADLHRLVFVIVLVACAPPATRDMHAASPSAAAALAPSPTAPSAATADEPTAPTLHPSDEAGTVLLGLQALAGAKHLRDPDLALLEPALRSSYARMRADEDDP